MIPGAELPALGAFAALIPLILAAASSAKRRLGLHPELARKAAHILLGLGTLSFPWLFSSPLPVWVLCAGAVLLLAAARHVPVLRRRFGEALGADRATAGEYWFPVAVASVFQLSGDRPVLYVVPVLILTLADGLGALVGVRYGATRYRSGEGLKSLEGSAAFFVTAFLSAHIPVLLMTGTGRLESLLIAALTGLLVMVMEAAAWRGLDNLFVPLLAFFLLDASLGLDAAALGLRLLVLAVLAAAALAPGKLSPLEGGARALALLFCFVFWAVGGWLWLLPVLALYAAVLALPAPPAGIQPARDTAAVLRIMAGPTLFTAAFLAGWRPASEAFVLAFACHLANVIVSRRAVLPAATSPALRLPAPLAVLLYAVIGGVAGFVIVHLPVLILAGGLPPRLVLAGSAAAALCAALFAASGRFASLRPLREAALAPACAALGAVLM